MLHNEQLDAILVLICCEQGQTVNSPDDQESRLCFNDGNGGSQVAGKGRWYDRGNGKGRALPASQDMQGPVAYCRNFHFLRRSCDDKACYFL